MGGGGGAASKKKAPASGIMSKLMNGGWTLGKYSLYGGGAGLGLWGAYKGYSETAKIEDSGKRLAAQGLLVSTVSSVGSGLGVLYLLRSNSALSKEVAEANKEIKLIREKMQEAPSEEAQRRALVLERGAEASILAHHKIGRIPTLPKGKKVLNETDAQLLERIHGELDQGNDDAASEVGN